MKAPILGNLKSFTACLLFHQIPTGKVRFLEALVYTLLAVLSLYHKTHSPHLSLSCWAGSLRLHSSCPARESLLPQDKTLPRY